MTDPRHPVPGDRRLPRPGRARLRTQIEERLAQVESILHDSVKTNHPVLAEAAEHLVAAGGKRFRPTLALLTAHFGDPRHPAVVKAAAAIELTHVASLHHDDVLDRASLRRGVQSVNARFGNRIAVQSGDFMLARASLLVAGLGAEALRAHEGVLSRLVNGQILELSGPAPGTDAVDHHLRTISDKTASLIALTARLGAHLSGADARTAGICAAFGEHLGTAFQLADDLLDIQSDSPHSGKTPGTDLRQGVATLPVLLLKSRPPNLDDPDEVRLRELLEQDLDDDAALAETLRLLRRHRALDDARARTRHHAEAARELLRALKRCATRRALDDLCGLVIETAAAPGARATRDPGERHRTR